MVVDEFHLDELGRLFRESLAAIETELSEQDRTDVHEYLDHGEYGVAYELLAFVLDKQKLPHPTALIVAGRKMGKR
ncbi:hypothetical protein SB461_26790 [Burkholderia cenocepacia]|uniref:hypothetical protein n=1 Tax=Burkholderia cenocepacia TaxID=95486 RepID=UPI002B2465B9|nr:hypothetical protein [Burkholderia cenocepacia]MEB2610106.1 hypothetical protein [Burkholderia cenocepacia]